MLGGRLSSPRRSGIGLGSALADVVAPGEFRNLRPLLLILACLAFTLPARAQTTTTSVDPAQVAAVDKAASDLHDVTSGIRSASLTDDDIRRRIAAIPPIEAHLTDALAPHAQAAGSGRAPRPAGAGAGPEPAGGGVRDHGRAQEPVALPRDDRRPGQAGQAAPGGCRPDEQGADRSASQQLRDPAMGPKPIHRGSGSRDGFDGRHSQGGSAPGRGRRRRRAPDRPRGAKPVLGPAPVAGRRPDGVPAGAGAPAAQSPGLPSSRILDARHAAAAVRRGRLAGSGGDADTPARRNCRTRHPQFCRRPDRRLRRFARARHSRD